MASPRMGLQLAPRLPCCLLISAGPGSSHGPSPSAAGWIMLLPPFKEVLTPSIPRDWLTFSKMIQLAWSLGKASLSVCGCVSTMKGGIPSGFQPRSTSSFWSCRAQSSLRNSRKVTSSPHPEFPGPHSCHFYASLVQSSVSTRRFTFWNTWPYSLQGWCGKWLKNKVVKNKTLTSISIVAIITGWPGLGLVYIQDTREKRKGKLKSLSGECGVRRIGNISPVERSNTTWFWVRLDAIATCPQIHTWWRELTWQF